jgi:hypothetical protein
MLIPELRKLLEDEYFFTLQNTIYAVQLFHDAASFSSKDKSDLRILAIKALRAHNKIRKGLGYEEPLDFSDFLNFNNEKSRVKFVKCKK